MIQRIQTIYILLFAILLFSALFFPFAVISNGPDIYSLYPGSGWEISNGGIDLGNSVYYIGYLVAISFSILMLVNYKKRTKQLRYGKICYLIVVITLVYMFNVIDVKSEILKHIS